MITNAKKLSDIITPDLAFIYLHDPIRFVNEVIFNKNWKLFGGKYELTPQQEEVLRALAKGDMNISVRAGRGIGKTALLSFIILYWMCVMPEPQLLVTAPSSAQLQGALWKQLRDWLKRSVVADCFVHTRTKMYNKHNKSCVAEPRTAAKIESVQGVHNEHLLIIADEASGIDNHIMETIYGSLTEEKNRMLMMFNPTKVNGFAYDSHNANKSLWKCFAFSSEFSPRVDHKWLSAMKKKHTSGDTVNDVYRVHVLGEFPKGDPEAILTMDEVHAAQHREVDKGGCVEIGVDLAEMGDDSTVVAPRWGNKILSASDIGFSENDILCSWGQVGAPETIKKILNIIKLTRNYTGYTGTITIKLDNGGPGSPIISFLEEYQKEYGFRAIRVNFGGSGNEFDRNEATTMWFNLKDIINEVQLPFDDFMLEEMVTRKWFLDKEGTGKRMVEPKREFKKRHGSSPDRADAVIMAFADVENYRNKVNSFGDVEKRLDVPSAMLESRGTHYLGLYVNSTGIMSAVACSYYRGSLGVYAVHEDVSEYVARSDIFMNDYTMILGSKSMFSEGENIAMRLRRSGIFVIEPFLYDEGGSLFGLDYLTSNKRFMIGDECEEFSEKMKTFTVNRTSGSLKETHGMCYAVCQVVSMLMLNNSNDFIPNKGRSNVRLYRQ